MSQLYYFYIEPKSSPFPSGFRGKICQEGIGFEKKSALGYSDPEQVSPCNVGDLEIIIGGLMIFSLD